MSDDDLTTIFVASLSLDATDPDLYDTFERFGSINHVSIIKDRDTNESRGFAFVEFSREESAEESIAASCVGNGVCVRGQPVVVELSRPRKDSFKGSAVETHRDERRQHREFVPRSNSYRDGRDRYNSSSSSSHNRDAYTHSRYNISPERYSRSPERHRRSTSDRYYTSPSRSHNRGAAERYRRESPEKCMESRVDYYEGRLHGGRYGRRDREDDGVGYYSRESERYRSSYRRGGHVSRYGRREAAPVNTAVVSYRY